MAAAGLPVVRTFRLGMTGLVLGLAAGLALGARPAGIALACRLGFRRRWAFRTACMSAFSSDFAFAGRDLVFPALAGLVGNFRFRGHERTPGIGLQASDGWKLVVSTRSRPTEKHFTPGRVPHREGRLHWNRIDRAAWGESRLGRRSGEQTGKKWLTTKVDHGHREEADRDRRRHAAPGRARRDRAELDRPG